jgi:septation ring formation regulator EzrA
VADLGVPLREVRRSDKLEITEVIHGALNPAQSPSIVARLIHLSAQNPELREQCLALVSDLQPMLDRAEALEKALLEQRQEDLKSQHEAIRKQCRVQAGVCSVLKQNLAAAELNLHNVAAKQEEALRKLQDMNYVRSQNRHVPQWATQAELDAWGELYAEQQQKVVDANTRVGLAMTERNAAMYKIEPATIEMDRLVAEEARLKGAVSGNPFVDLELGLSSQAVGYVTAG